MEDLMVTKSKDSTTYQRGLFRYGVIAELLSRPPSEGELATRLREILTRAFDAAF